jgi:DNA-directed RNA polymerase specialized sigma24 family protein
MSTDIPHPVTPELAELHSPDRVVRERASSLVWERFEPRMLDLLRRRVIPTTAPNLFAEEPIQGQPSLADREAFWRLMVRATLSWLAGAGWHDPHAQQELSSTANRPAFSPHSIEALASWIFRHERPVLLREESMLSREELNTLLARLLDPLQQIVLWKLGDLSNAEIARILNRTERTVELRLRIIRKTLETEPAGTLSDPHGDRPRLIP